MQHRSTFFLAVTLSLLASCACGAATPPPGGGPAWAGSSLEHDANGVLRKGRLRSDSEIQGIACRGWVHFDEQGELAQCKLAEDRAFQGGLVVPEDSTVFLNPDATLDYAWLARSMEIEGVPCRGGGKMSTSFHPNGRVRTTFLSREAVFDGFRCSDSVMEPTTFRPDGSLAACTLAEAVTVDGTEWKRGTEVAIDADGGVTRAR